MSSWLMGPKNGVIALQHSTRNVCPDADASGGPAAASATGTAPSMVGAEAEADRGPRPSAPEFADVYEGHFDFVWRSLRLLGVPSEAVEDVTQDTFDVVSRQLGHFEGRSSLRTWLFSIAQRTAANYRRMARRKLSRLEPLSELTHSAEPTPHAHAEAMEAAAVVERFVEGLDAEWRTLFVLSVLEGVPGAEVAEALGIPVNTVYSRMRTLRDSLRQAFERRARRGA